MPTEAKKLIAPSGNEYTGEVEVGSNKGTFKCEKNGKVYTGEFLGDKMHGYGKLEWPGHETYAGLWDNGVKSGIGECIYTNGANKGDLYRGSFTNSLFNGFGEYHFAGDSKVIYRGRFQDNKPNGTGELVDATTGQVLYQGEWVNGMKHGFAEDYTFEGSDCYVGGVQNSKRHGKGRSVKSSLFSKVPAITDRMWENDRDIAPCDNMADVINRVESGLVSCHSAHPDCSLIL